MSRFASTAMKVFKSTWKHVRSTGFRSDHIFCKRMNLWWLKAFFFLQFPSICIYPGVTTEAVLLFMSISASTLSPPPDRSGSSSIVHHNSVFIRVPEFYQDGQAAQALVKILPFLPLCVIRNLPSKPVQTRLLLPRPWHALGWELWREASIVSPWES